LPYFSIPLATVINNELGESGEFLGELIVSATKEKIVMLELEAPEIPEDKLLSAVELAHQEICYLIGFFEYIANSLRIKKEEREINHLAERTAVEFEEKVKVCLTRIFRDPNYS
jgi:polyribonucleotide nucleotidyltransferase